MKTTAINTGISFKEFITNCEVSVCGTCDYAVNYGDDTDLGYNVNTSDKWVITNSYGVQEDLTEWQIKDLMDMVSDFIKNDSVDTSDYESPWETEGVFPPNFKINIAS